MATRLAPCSSRTSTKRPAATTTVRTRLPGPGTLKAKQTPKKKAPTLVKPTTVKIKKAGILSVLLKPTKAGLRKLKKAGKFKSRLSFTYTPHGGKPNTQKRSYLFKKK